MFLLELISTSVPYIFIGIEVILVEIIDTPIGMLGTPTGVCAISIGAWVITAGIVDTPVVMLGTPTGVHTISIGVWGNTDWNLCHAHWYLKNSS